MNYLSKLASIGSIAAVGVFTTAYAAPPEGGTPGTLGNSYHIYTKAIQIDESGVASVPSRFQWSVATSYRGYDAQGIAIDDSRLMLRLYDPAQNFTVLTAQMDLATAAKLHHDLGHILVKKLQDPSFQHQPKLYDERDISRGRFKGVDENGTAIIEFESPSRTLPLP